MTLYEMMEKIAENNIFARPDDFETVCLMKYNEEETENYLRGMVSIGQVDYDYIDNYVSHPKIDLENDTLTEADKALLKEVFNL
jgi:hypothetical protein